MLYRNLSSYLREKYGKRLDKICIDGGFSCPNRDGKCGFGGCIFCGERGAGEHIDPTSSISDQVRNRLKKSNTGDIFVAYFQNFTNTYAPVKVLKERYDAALIDDRIRVLAIGTRPDCIDEDVCKLLAEYAKEREVWVELGLQTSSDKTAEIINRGYKTEVFVQAMRLLERYGLKVVVHILLGLPGESVEDMKKTADFVSSFPIFGLKIHSIYVMKGTELERLYLEKRYTPPTLDDYCEATAYAVAKMPLDVVIHRLAANCPKGMLVAPEWNADKTIVIDGVTDKMRALGYKQGCLADK
jgi:radical SAM protein (TIGR01212 family)